MNWTGTRRPTLDVGLASCRLGILDRFCTGPHALRRPGSESRKVHCAIAKAAELTAHSIAFLVLCEAGRGHQPLGACVLLAARVLPAVSVRVGSRAAAKACGGIVPEPFPPAA